MGMHARVMRVELSDVDRGIAFVRDRIVPAVRQQQGIAAAYWLVDRAGGHGLAVTIWDSETAMLAADAAARESARTEKRDGAVETATLELYEVVAQLSTGPDGQPAP
jgi:hypothetical protein